MVGVIVLLYDHRKRELSDELVELQHRHRDLVLAAMHIHLDEANCLEVLAVKGPGKELQLLAEHLCSLKGVKHGQLAAISTGKGLH